MIKLPKYYQGTFLVFSALMAWGCKKASVFIQHVRPETVIGAGDARLAAGVLHLVKDTVYILGANLGRDSGQTLSIDAGTLIKVRDKISITINPGAVIEAKGTEAEPVVFTSAADKGSAGRVYAGGGTDDHYWYGIRINGNALKNPGAGSGILSHVRIEFAGGYDNTGIQANLLLKNVNTATTIGNIQVSYSYGGPSFELYGGNFNAGMLVSYASSGNDFYIHQGYTGMLQHLLAYRHPYFPIDINLTLTGLLIEDAATAPLISNLTVLGPGLQSRTSGAYFTADNIYTKYRLASLITAGGCNFHIRNSVLQGFPREGWYLNDNATATAIVNGASDLTYSVLQCNDTTRTFYLPPNTYPGASSQDFKDYMLQPAFGNQLFLNPGQFQLKAPYDFDTAPDPAPAAGSSLLSGANFDDAFGDAFFIKTNYRGALGADSWLKGWTNFTPLQTNYN